LKKCDGFQNRWSSKLNMKKYIIYITIILAVSFLTYCFFPIITYDSSNEPGRIFLKDRNWIVITDKANEYWYRKEIDVDLNSQFVKDLLKIEDKNYYSHLWVDIFSKIWAIRSNILQWKVVSWWSTITEQYIKNKYFPNQKRTYLQKSREAILSICFSVPYIPSPLGGGLGWGTLKDKTLETHLNNIYFWNNVYWIWSAIEVYFWKQNLSELNKEEIILLISLIHNPSVKSLEEKSFSQYFDKIEKKLWYNFKRTIYRLNKKENIDKFPFVTNRTISSKIHPSPAGEGPGVRFVLWETNGNSVSIDSKLQLFSKDVLNKTLNWLKDKNVTNWAIFAVNPKTREVLIYQWSKDFNSEEIDWQVDVIQSLRQPWSSMKPFLYLMALENWANPDDLLLDLDNKYNSFSEWKTYISNNYSLKEYWLVRFKKALWNSLNNASVRLASELGLNKVYEFYKKYGFKLVESFDYYGYSLVLWNPSIKLEDLVWSYCRLLPKNNPSTRSSVPPLEKGEINEEEQAKFLLYDILSNPDNRDLSFWVNSILNTSIYQAVKTWTSSDFRDNVIVSYHPDFVIWIWIGNNDNSSMVGVTWITWAWYIWHNIIEKAIELWYIKDENISIPKWLEKSNYCLDKKCYRKELVYKKEWKEYLSRIIEWNYSQKDIYENLTDDEVERLKNFQIYFK